MKRALRIVLFGLLALVLTAAVALALVVKIGLAPARGEWAIERSVGPLTLELGVPTVLRVATSPWLAPWLDGLRLDTRHGPVQLRWDDGAQQLTARCAPCTAQVAALGSQPLQLDHLEITVHRDASRLRGTLEAAAPQGPNRPPGADAPLRGQWTGRLSQTALDLDVRIQDAPIARWYAVGAPHLPELQRARITGTLALQAQVSQPSGAFKLQPQVAQFSVEGLGTDAMLGARSSCGAPSRLTDQSWLARAVIAAEDQRFFNHPGYDLIELGVALDRNQAKGGIDRGGSTLTQQLAKMLVTGSERSLERKLRELLYAVEMENTLGKARILQLYLDNAPWGRVCGAEAAAQLYFKRSAQRLEPAQAVWLASMLHAPGLAAERWAKEGELDAKRLQWVAESIRGISRRQREALLKQVEQARYPWVADGGVAAVR
ncbi:MAG: glycosyl transferase [Comamonadaceae bacterium]|nr:MAG: glycosyl transferase [Comamonadaceae bacterium]